MTRKMNQAFSPALTSGKSAAIPVGARAKLQSRSEDVPEKYKYKLALHVQCRNPKRFGKLGTILQESCRTWGSFRVIYRALRRAPGRVNAGGKGIVGWQLVQEKKRCAELESLRGRRCNRPIGHIVVSAIVIMLQRDVRDLCQTGADESLHTIRRHTID